MSIQIWQNNLPADRETREGYQKYSGVMDEKWREMIRKEWEGTGENKRSGVLGQAYLYSDFQGVLESAVESMKEELAARDPGYDTGRVSRAYEALGRAGNLQFGPSQSFFAMISNMKFIKDCTILFLILLCGTIFTGERETGMDALVAVSRNGRKRLFWRKFIACQVSSLFLWLAMNGLAAGTIWFRMGWSGLEGVVQDFTFNVSPFPWNQREYLWVVGLTGLAACQLVSAVAFFIGCLAKSSVQSVLGAFCILFLPVAAYSLFDVMRAFFPNFLSGDYLWNHYSEWRIGPWYIPEWKMALIQLAALYSAVLLWCKLKGKSLQGDG